MESRDLGDIDAWLTTARELDLVESHEVQSVMRLRSTLVEDQAILGKLAEMADAVEGRLDQVDTPEMQELTRLLAAASSRNFTSESHPESVGRAADAMTKLRALNDAIHQLTLAVSHRRDSLSVSVKDDTHI
jgi:hypothetical protein